MASFDLRHEPWIPVVYHDGGREELGLRELLARAPTIREISDPIPTAEFGLYRLLVALVMDIFTLRDTEDLAEVLETGAFNAVTVDAYFAKWSDRFDLFHPTYPFYQSAGMSGEEEKPFALVLPSIPSGTNVNHFHHHPEGNFGVSPAVAARILTTIPTFMIAGGPGYSPSINSAPPWYVLVRGKSLFETLCLNCCVTLHPNPSGDAPPCWCWNAPVEYKKYTETSLLQALTWQPRRLRLIPGEEGECALTGWRSPVIVCRMNFLPGASYGFRWHDPNVAYKRSKTVTSISPTEGRELWRDTGPLALLRENEYESQIGKIRFERPQIINQFQLLHDQQILSQDAQIELRIFGMRTDSAKVFEWQCEQLILPVSLIREGINCGEAQRAMESADSISNALKEAIKMAYPRDGKGNKAAFSSIITDAQRDYWATLRVDFYSLLLDLAALPTGDARDVPLSACRKYWHTRLQKVGSMILEDALCDLDTDADALERQVRAREKFQSVLWKLIEPKGRPKAKKGKED